MDVKRVCSVLSGIKGRMGRARGCTELLRAFEYKPVPLNLMGKISMATVLWHQKVS